MWAIRRDVPPAPVDAATPDAGFALVEVVVAVVLIGIVMAASTSFFVTMSVETNLSGGQQTAAQLTTDGIEDARAVPVADLRTASANGSWTPPFAVGSEDPRRPVRNGIQFARTWSIVACWLPPAGGSCGAQAAGYLPFLRVTVAVTWPDRRCGSAPCSLTTSTLISSTPREPVFAP